jgi:hypothetical protein
MSKWLSAPVLLPAATFGSCSGCRPHLAAIGRSFEQNRTMLAGKADLTDRPLARRSVFNASSLAACPFFE